jgi:hypothetical protein
MAEHEPSFTVTDRRSSQATQTIEADHAQATQAPDAPGGAAPSEAAPPPHDASQASASDAGHAIPLPEANLLTLVFSLYTHTQICLGLLPDPISQQPQQDLNQAKYNIDMLAMLKQKTAGNLTAEEEQTLENVLYEVRMTYVSVKK